jgi:hypothetical protein
VEGAGPPAVNAVTPSRENGVLFQCAAS